MGRHRPQRKSRSSLGQASRPLFSAECCQPPAEHATEAISSATPAVKIRNCKAVAQTLVTESHTSMAHEHGHLLRFAPFSFALLALELALALACPSARGLTIHTTSQATINGHGNQAHT